MINKSVTNSSSDAYDQFRNSNYQSNSNSSSISNLTLPLIEIREGNLLELDWSDADLIYLSSICFPGNITIIIIIIIIIIITVIINIIRRDDERYLLEVSKS
jgi:hypothetical protein